MFNQQTTTNPDPIGSGFLLPKFRGIVSETKQADAEIVATVGVILVSGTNVNYLSVDAKL